MSGKYSPSKLSGEAHERFEAAVLAYLMASAEGAGSDHLAEIRARCHVLLDARLEIFDLIGEAVKISGEAMLAQTLAAKSTDDPDAPSGRGEPQP